MSEQQIDLESTSDRYFQHPLTIEMEKRFHRTTSKSASFDRKDVFNAILPTETFQSLLYVIQGCRHLLTVRHGKT